MPERIKFEIIKHLSLHVHTILPQLCKDQMDISIVNRVRTVVLLSVFCLTSDGINNDFICGGFLYFER